MGGAVGREDERLLLLLRAQSWISHRDEEAEDGEHHQAADAHQPHLRGLGEVLPDELGLAAGALGELAALAGALGGGHRRGGGRGLRGERGAGAAGGAAAGDAGDLALGGALAVVVFVVGAGAAAAGAGVGFLTATLEGRRCRALARIASISSTDFIMVALPSSVGAHLVVADVPLVFFLREAAARRA